MEAILSKSKQPQMAGMDIVLTIYYIRWGGNFVGESGGKWLGG
ncbi:hypothetical protein [Acidaminococcus fermentans]